MTSQDSLERLDDDAATLPLAELHVEVGDRAIRFARQDVDLAPALGAPPSAIVAVAAIGGTNGCRRDQRLRRSPFSPFGAPAFP